MATPLLIVTIQMKATEQYIPMVLFIMLYKVFQTFKSVVSPTAILNEEKALGTRLYEIQKSDQLKKLMSSAFLWCC